MRIGFYAPMKPPDAPTPSGDRTLARAAVKAIALAGHEPILMSRLRVWDGKGDGTAQGQSITAAARECETLLKGSTAPPDLWLTYHSHYKAPDLLGPTLSRAWACPYVIIEGSFSKRRAHGPWGAFHRLNEIALGAASCHLVLSPRDRSGIASVAGADALILDCPPFLDLDLYKDLSPPPQSGPVRLLTVAMARVGDKTRSYELLAEALTRLRARQDGPAWTWEVAGDGPGFEVLKVARHLEALCDVTTRRGRVPGEDVPAMLARCHLVAWPGFGEGIGMVYVEAMAAGRPVVAVEGAASGVLEPPLGGLLAPATADGLAAVLADLIRSPRRRAWIGAAGAARARERHGLNAMARLLNDVFDKLVERDP